MSKSRRKELDIASPRRNKSAENPTTTQSSMENELENMMASRIDEEYIMALTSVKDLCRVEYLSLQIDTTIQSLLDLPDLLPNLKHLVLDNSTITSIRDLGVGLRNITTLSLSGCGLHDIDGIGVLTGLQELSLSDNYISDVTPLTMHENLQTINLSGNKIGDLSFGTVLATCPSLTTISLSRNPIDRIPQYRMIVPYMIPTVLILDNTPINKQAMHKVTNAIYPEAVNALKLIEEELNDEDRLENEIYQDILPTASHNNVRSGGGGSVANSTQSSGKAGSFSAANSMDLLPDTGSILTHGSSVVLAGNVAAAMRKRRQHAEDEHLGGGQATPMRPKTATTSSTQYGEGGKEFESALDVLDMALIGNGEDAPYTLNSTHGKHPPSSFIREGDITDAVLGRISPIKAPHSTTVNKHHGLELAFDAMSPTLHSGKHTGRSQHHPATDHQESTGFLSATRRPKSAFSGSVVRYSSDPKTALADGYSAASSAPSSRPLTASKPGTPDGSNKQSYFIADAGEIRSILSSPRQRNSSRPATADSTSIPFPSSIPSTLPFHVVSSYNTSNSQPPQRRPMSSRPKNHAILSAPSCEDFDYGSSDDENSSSFPTTGIASSSRRIAGMYAEDSSTPSLLQHSKSTSIVHLDIVKRNTKQQDNNLSSSASSSSLNTSNMNNLNDDGEISTIPWIVQRRVAIAEEDSEEDEEIAVTHSERLRMMSTSTSHQTTSLFKSRQNVLLKLQSKVPLDLPGPVEEDWSDRRPMSGTTNSGNSTSRARRGSFNSTTSKDTITTITNENNKNNNNKSTPQEYEHSVSSKAGMSLGFNLAGSLAAIDQWVHAMGTSSDENSDDEEEHGMIAKSNTVDSEDDEDGRQYRYGDEDDEDGEEDGDEADEKTLLSLTSSCLLTIPALNLTSSTASLQSQNNNNNNSLNKSINANSMLKEKILSRDMIFNMCSNSSNSGQPQTNNNSNSNNNNTTNSHTTIMKQQQQQHQAALPPSGSHHQTKTTTKHHDDTPATSSTTTAGGRDVQLPQQQQPARNNSINTSHPNPLPTDHKKSSSRSATPSKATALSDEELVDLLRKPPKSVAMLRTKASFQEFFRGVDAIRFKHLVEKAYGDILDIHERESKIKRRIELMEGAVN